MIRRNPLKLLFYLCLAIVVALVGYKVYLNFFKQDFEALHSGQVERIHQHRLNASTNALRQAPVSVLRWWATSTIPWASSSAGLSRP